LTAPLLAVAGLSKTFAVAGRRIAAVEDASPSLAPGRATPPQIGPRFREAAS
jgi:hypothetical protein